eukprot:TRINITY_DN17313_c0_g1_i17.p1 TRINITY_DN17313_c0_g1~~TRINITY_DN17313_c0_g1_i17.p1  ORF type:complete len:331 (-),score=90.96 TRINITY_DN17313_c0_g1_i17:116-1084(-)
MIRRPPRSTHCISSAASDVYKRQVQMCKISLRFGCRGFWVLETLCNHAKDAVLNQLFLPRIAKLVNMLSTSFYGKKAERYQVSNAEEVGLKLGKVLRGVVACSAGLCDSEEFVQEVAGGNEYLQLDALKRSARAARVLSASDYGCTCSCRNYSDCGVREANRKGGEGGGERGQHGGLHRGAGRVHRHAHMRRDEGPGDAALEEHLRHVDCQEGGDGVSVCASDRNGKDPYTNVPLRLEDVKSHVELKKRIERWIQQKRAGVITDEDKKKEEKKGGGKEQANAPKGKSKTKEDDYASFLQGSVPGSAPTNGMENYESSLKLDD